MRKIMYQKLSTLITIALFAFLIVNCKESEKPSLTGVFTFIKGTVTQNGQPVRLGSVVKEGDVLVSKRKSAAVIQFASGALVTLKSESKLVVSILSQGKDGKRLVTLFQEKGSTFSKIISSEQIDYSINAPTLTAGVRGTSFELNVSKDGGTEVKLLSGKVAVSPEQKKLVKQQKMFFLRAVKR